MDTRIQAAYDHCLDIAGRHYENFPVASWLLPKRCRGPVAAIYAFARAIDDFADEGERNPVERLMLLADWAARVDRATRGEEDDHPVFIALGDAMRRFRLPPQLFHDLISAFRQDVTQKRYSDFRQLAFYCSNSADPVGRLLLHLTRNATPENLELSDRVCSALQLINFLQDIRQDYRELGRIYIPRDEMEHWGVSEEELGEGRVTPQVRELLAFQLRRARRMLLEGKPLGRRLHGRFGLEIRLIIQGGLKVVRLLEGAEDPFSRPRLNKIDYLGMFVRSL